MKKIIKKTINPHIVFYVALGISIIVLSLLMILIDERNLSQIVIFTKALWVFLIIGSVVYSASSIRDDLFYQLSFGVTRKKMYLKYLFNLLCVLGCLVIYIVVISIMLLILYKTKYILMYLKEIYFIEYLSLGAILNMAFFYFGRFFKNRYVFYGFVFVLAIVLFMFNFVEYLGYTSFILLVISGIAIYLNYLYIKKTIDF